MATVRSYDNSGNLSNEISTCYVDSKMIVTNTNYNNSGGHQRVTTQTVSVTDQKDQSKSYTKTVLGGKLLP